MPPVLWWVEKGFRLADLPALTAALDAGGPVIPVSLFEPAVLRTEERSGFHVVGRIEALGDLRARLRPHGGDVFVLHADAFGRLYHAVAFEAIYSHEETGSNVTFERDKAIAEGVYARHGAHKPARARTWKSNVPHKTKNAPLPANG